jgi:hypothetical protein
MTIRLNPFWMLDAQIVMDLVLKLAVRMNFLRHGHFLSKGSSQKQIHFHPSSYGWWSCCIYCACAGFLIATPGVIRNPSFGVDFVFK